MVCLDPFKIYVDAIAEANSGSEMDNIGISTHSFLSYQTVWSSCQR